MLIFLLTPNCTKYGCYKAGIAVPGTMCASVRLCLSGTQTMISIFSVVAFPCVMLEYFYTKERITEESRNLGKKMVQVSISDQLKDCLASKYWVIMIAVLFIYQFCTNIQNTSLVYYCNWVLGTYNDGSTKTIVSAVGNAPLGFGILLMWPLVNKFGKRKVMLIGLLVALIGTGMFLMNPTSLGPVLGALILRAFGALPLTYIVMGMVHLLPPPDQQAEMRKTGLCGETDYPA